MNTVGLERFALCLLYLFHFAYCSSDDSSSDIGYDLLYKSNTKEYSKTCAELDSSLKWMKGTFLLPSIAQFELNDKRFQGTFDAFGKLHRFDFADGQFCSQSRMLRSKFYNTSMEQNSVTAELLFLDTSPSLSKSPVKRLAGANDNNMVNSYELGGKVRMVSDSPVFLDLDLNTLDVIGSWMYGDLIAGLDIPGGCAHPVKRSNGCIVNVDPWQSFDTKKLSRTGVTIYESCPDSPSNRTKLNSYKSDFSPYLHSFGLTENFAIIPHQNGYYTYAEYMKQPKDDCDFINAFQDDGKDSFQMVLVPLSGEDAVSITINEKLYYVHVINSYETDDGVVVDLSRWTEEKPFLYEPFGKTSSVDYLRDPQQRNDKSNLNYSKRYTIYTKGPKKGTYETTELTSKDKSTEFPNINHAYSASPYCYFYANEWFHDNVTYGAMAMVKQTVCDTGDSRPAPVYWYKKNFYPSEPTFIPYPASKREDDGVLVFTVLDGTTEESYFEIVDAATMKTIQEIHLPTRLTFTVHGQFYENFVY